MRKLSWWIALLVAIATAMTLTGCGRSTESTGAGGQEKGTIGIAMPTKSSERWVGDGQNMVAQFEELGYQTDLQYGDDVVQNQVSQIENMITKGVQLLVIAPIDGSSLTNTLQRAADANIPVISYDRLIKGTPNVDYYATFDNFKVGVLQAQYIVDKLGLANGARPFNIELFAGSPDDNNATFFYDGAMSVLKPYLDSGKLVVPSGQTTFDQVATPLTQVIVRRVAAHRTAAAFLLSATPCARRGPVPEYHLVTEAGDDGTPRMRVERAPRD